MCAGQHDNKFVEFIQSKKGGWTDPKSRPVSHLDEYAPTNFDGCTYPQTVRSIKSEVLVSYGNVMLAKHTKALIEYYLIIIKLEIQKVSVTAVVTQTTDTLVHQKKSKADKIEKASSL